MIKITEPISEYFDDGINWEEVYQRWEKEIIDYNNGDEEYKQNYWSNLFCEGLYQRGHIVFPVDIKKYRKKEPNIEKFLLGAIKAMEENTGEKCTNIEDAFILDNQAKQYLEKIGYFESEEVKNNVKRLIN